jgi:hypothetical protein
MGLKYEPPLEPLHISADGGQAYEPTPWTLNPFHCTLGVFGGKVPILPDFHGREHMVAMLVSIRNLITGSIQFKCDPDDLATKITTQLVHKSNCKTYEL